MPKGIGRRRGNSGRFVAKQAAVKNERTNLGIADDPLSKYHIAVASY